MLEKLLGPEIQELIDAKNYGALRQMMVDIEAPDLADIVSDLSPDHTAVIMRILPRHLAAGVFEYLSLENQERVIRTLAQEQVAQLLNDMAPDDRTALLEELPAAMTQRMLELLKPEELKVAKTLLGYPEESVGRRMTPDYRTVQPEWTVQRVLEHIRRRGRDSETLNALYVRDQTGRLVDEIRLRNILLSAPETIVSDLMDRQVYSLKATDDQEVAVEAFKKYNRTALPVTDSDGRMIGILTVDDVLEVAEEENTEDIQKLGGMAALETSYLGTGVMGMVRKRAGWLVVLMIGEMLTATAMTRYEDELAKAVVLAVFIPLIISCGGNSGSQSATLIIRSLALGELSVKDWFRVFRQELFSGLILGGILGVVGFCRIALWGSIGHAYGEHWPRLGLTVLISLIGVVLWGCLSGALMPLLIKRLGLDPATSSAPFVATLVDVTGLIIYFSTAAMMLHGTLL